MDVLSDEHGNDVFGVSIVIPGKHLEVISETHLTLWVRVDAAEVPEHPVQVLGHLVLSERRWCLHHTLLTIKMRKLKKRVNCCATIKAFLRQIWTKLIYIHLMKSRIIIDRELSVWHHCAHWGSHHAIRWLLVMVSKVWHHASIWMLHVDMV